MTVAKMFEAQVAVHALLVAAMNGFELNGEPITVPVFDHPPAEQTGVFIIIDGFGVRDRSHKDYEVAAHTFMVRVHMRSGGNEAYQLGLDTISAVTAAAHIGLMAGEICGNSPTHIYTESDAGEDGTLPSSTSRYRVII